MYGIKQFDKQIVTFKLDKDRKPITLIRRELFSYVCRVINPIQGVKKVEIFTIWVFTLTTQCIIKIKIKKFLDGLTKGVTDDMVKCKSGCPVSTKLKRCKVVVKKMIVIKTILIIGRITRTSSYSNTKNKRKGIIKHYYSQKRTRITG